MSRPTLETLSTIVLTTIVSLTPLACDSSSGAAEASEQPVEIAAVGAATNPTLPLEATAPMAPEAAVPPIDDQPVLASGMAPSAKPASFESERAAQAIEPARSRRDRAPGSLRSPSLLPAGTPEAHVVAFTHLSIGKRDKAPIGGVGASGIHLDELEVGKGWGSSRCEDLGGQFDVDVDERVNVCFRVVHPREAEATTVEWARDGKVRQIIRVNVNPTHAYLTRAWLPVTAGRAGDWSATIKSEDGSVLGQVEFEITSESVGE